MDSVWLFMKSNPKLQCTWLIALIIFYLLGACEGTLTCSTCHVILSQKDYDAAPNKPLDEELDMLDLAFGLTDT